MSLLACMTLAFAARTEPVKLLPGPFELPGRSGPTRFDGITNPTIRASARRAVCHGSPRPLPLEPAAFWRGDAS